LADGQFAQRARKQLLKKQSSATESGLASDITDRKHAKPQASNDNIMLGILRARAPKASHISA
jgi:hypothetical protein